MKRRNTGQTVFLSSHILSEVEALYGQIAILREGHLVELGRLDELQHLTASSVSKPFDGSPSLTSRRCPVSVMSLPTSMACICNWSPLVRKLIQELARSDVTGLQSREPSLRGALP